MTTTTDLIHRYYAAFNAKDWSGMAACVSEDLNHFVNEGDKRGGRKAFAEFIVNGTYKKTDPGLPEARGQKYRLPAGAFFDLKDGEIRRVTTYYNLKEWIRQVS